ncbi:MAG TPA: ATP-binding protein [Ferruginibacter sp.]|mgnify:CR=1 FL=1|nr:ATP-binding protein [Ferruginibacter sp.]HMP19937.1 ATP-binding protein [Ferruginibacter sp.]
MNRIKKIVIVGPESTGKSTLCEKLALHYHTHWVKEYAREYLLKNGTNYSFDNLSDIARGQLRLEEEGIALLNKKAVDSKTPLPLFIDTDMYVMKVWCEFVFGKCHQWILNEVVSRKYDLYLLCNVDAPWVKDELREYPDFESRERLYHHYKDAMINQATPWVDISGNYEERFKKAIMAVDALLKASS